MISPDEQNTLGQDKNAAFEEAELRLLKEGLARSYTERFLFWSLLYKIGQTLAKAKVTHQPDLPPKSTTDGHI